MASTAKRACISFGIVLGVIFGLKAPISPATPNLKERQYVLSVYRNGESDSGVNALLPTSSCVDEQSLLVWAAESIGLSDPHSKHSLYDGSGQSVRSCEDIKKFAIDDASGLVSRLSLYVVPEGRWFVFPTVELGHAVQLKHIPPPRGKDHPIIVESISFSPRVFHLHNLISESEADALVSYALANDDPVMGLQRSTTGAEHQVSFSKIRTSENAFDSVSPTARIVKQRAIKLLGMEPYDDEMTDGLQVLRYNSSKAYISHVDYLDDNGSGHDYDSSKNGSNRFATILFYLSDVEEGGETVFELGNAVDDGVVDELDGVTPLVEDESIESILGSLKRGDFYQTRRRRYNNGSLIPSSSTSNPLSLFQQGSWEEKMVGRCRSALSVRPTKAHAVLFYSQHPDGRLDPMSKHGGCPVIAGTKWAANLWIWNKVRLGYPRAPRKEGAQKFDSRKGIGRDRLKEMETSPNSELTAVFKNIDIPGAKLFFQESQFMGDLPPGNELRFNSYAGHQWKVVDSKGVTMLSVVLNSDATQTYIASVNR